MTLRELTLMADGRMKHDWSIAAQQMALAANVNRAAGSRPWTARDFDPFAVRQPKVGVEILRSVFCGGSR